MIDTNKIARDLSNVIKVIGGTEYLCFDKSFNLNYRPIKNFTLAELLTKNKQDSYTQIAIPILQELQDIRNHWNSGIRINSSYRNASYNRLVGGATNSQHLLSTALDISPVNNNINDFKKLILSVKKTGGIGINYNSFVHIDCRNNHIIF